MFADLAIRLWPELYTDVFKFEFECFAGQGCLTLRFHDTITPCCLISGSRPHTDVTYLAQGAAGLGQLSLVSRG